MRDGVVKLHSFFYDEGTCLSLIGTNETKRCVPPFHVSEAGCSNAAAGGKTGLQRMLKPCLQMHGDAFIRPSALFHYDQGMILQILFQAQEIGMLIAKIIRIMHRRHQFSIQRGKDHVVSLIAGEGSFGIMRPGQSLQRSLLQKTLSAKSFSSKSFSSFI